jgi:hypothetical protein
LFSERQLDRRQFILGMAAASSFALSASAACTRVPLRRRIGISIPYEAEILNEFYADMKREAQKPEIDLQLVLIDAGGDFVKQSMDIEMFIAQGFGGVFMFVLPEGLDRIVALAKAKGVCLFNHSASPVTGCTQNIVLDQYEAGYKVGSFAAQWIREKRDGKAEIGLLTNLTDPELIVRSRGIKEECGKTVRGPCSWGKSKPIRRTGELLRRRISCKRIPTFRFFWLLVTIQGLARTPPHWRRERKIQTHSLLAVQTEHG